jgi:phenylpropionate dioxygenase-like ring-hydroxylating dioxygenase large terminal subunit
MRPDVQASLIERILAHVEARPIDMSDSTARMKVTRYTDPAILEAERRVLFRGFPLPLAHTSALSRPGDFVTHDLGETPVLAVVDREGERRAFLNVCRHRGTRLEEAPCGAGKKAFVCPYHAWTYDLGGALLHVPHEEGFAELDRATRGLVPLQLVDRHGFLWIAPSRDATFDLDRFLGPTLADDLASYGLETHHVYRPVVWQKSMNWKLAIDIFLEAYHVKKVHEKSIYPVFFDNVALFERHERHMRNTFPKRSVRELVGRARESWALRPHANILYYLFPNTLMLVQPDHVSVFSVFPRGVASCAIESYTLVPEAPETEKAVRHWDRNIEILHGAVAEDMVMGESIQRALGSGANEDVLFGRYEQSLAWFHGEIERALQLT